MSWEPGSPSLHKRQRGGSQMKKLFMIFVISVICAPIIFLIYYNNGLVCAPRAIFSSALFGIVPLIFLTIAITKTKKIFYYFSLCVLIIEVIITPIIMLKNLGWEKFITERLLAFFTFEGFALLQIIVVILLLLKFVKAKKNMSM